MNFLWFIRIYVEFSVIFVSDLMDLIQQWLTAKSLVYPEKNVREKEKKISSAA